MSKEPLPRSPWKKVSTLAEVEVPAEIQAMHLQAVILQLDADVPFGREEGDRLDFRFPDRRSAGPSATSKRSSAAAQRQRIDDGKDAHGSHLSETHVRERLPLRADTARHVRRRQRM